MLATKDLMNEHLLILNYVALMERYASQPDTAVLLAQSSHFIAFIHEFADDFHHAKEEAILFHYLLAPDVLTHCNPIPQMLYEHNKARELVRNMENALATSNLTALIAAMTQYASLLREHIHKEDHILYPMAERGLSDTAKASLLNDYADADQRLDSAAIWQRYQTLYNELANKLG